MEIYIKEHKLTLISLKLKLPILLYIVNSRQFNKLTPVSVSVLLSTIKWCDVSEQERHIKTLASICFYNNKSSEMSNLLVKMKKTQQNAWLFKNSTMLLSMTFLAWWLHGYRRQTTVKNLTGWVMPLPCIN